MVSDPKIGHQTTGLCYTLSVGEITSLFVHKVVRQVDDALDKPALLASVGLDAQAGIDTDRMVKDVNYYALLERIASADPDAIELPLRVGASMRCDDYGAFGLAWKSAPTLRDSFQRAERYARVLTNVAFYEVEETEDDVWFHLHRHGERRLGLRLSNEATLASVAAISREIAPAPLTFEGVYLKHDAPASTDAHERYFGCPIHFRAGRDALRLSVETSRHPNRLGDPAISAFFDAHLEGELSRVGEEAPLEHQVRIRIAQALSQGGPRITDIAAGMGVSPRSLQRRLAERGYAFQTLVDEARRDLAEQLLGGTDYPLAEVAFLTGFSEQSAFNRAFKRWAGQTPRAFRSARRSRRD